MDLIAKSKKILESKSNSNLLIDVIQELYGENEEVICNAIVTIQDTFCTLIERGDLDVDSLPTSVDIVLTSEASAEVKYKEWLQERYTDATSQLLAALEHSADKVQNASCICLSALISTEFQRKNSSSSLLKELVKKLLTSEIKMEQTTNRCHHLDSIDALKTVLNLLKQNQAPSETFLWNTFFILAKIQWQDNSEVVKKEKSREMVCKLYSAAWLQFLKRQLPLPLYKKVLIVMYQKVLQQLANPLLMTDFLTDSYNIGGIVSLLALNGIYFLMQKFNLEYPDFYQKLYSLLDEEMLYVKYRARFFFLTDLFLTSTHLPAYLVAAFAKKLSRLALVAPVDALVVIIPLVGNLLIRHPTLRFLIHGESSELTTDPYLPLEELVNCHAMQSSLWELKSLQNHWHPDISTRASFINKPLPGVEWDLSNLLEVSYVELLEKEYSFELNDDIPIAY